MAKPNMDDYIDVAVRVQNFKAKFPDGSVQCERPRDVIVGDRHFIEVTAWAYRAPEDRRPGVASAREPFPGRTPYTKDSEMMNAETSAIGRALVALGFTTNGKIASAEEVRNRAAEQEAEKRGDVIPAARVRKIAAAYTAAKPEEGADKFEQDIKFWLVAEGVDCDTNANIGVIVEGLSKAEADKLEAHLRELAPKAEES